MGEASIDGEHGFFPPFVLKSLQTKSYRMKSTLAFSEAAPAPLVASLGRVTRLKPWRATSLLMFPLNPDDLRA